MHHCFIQRARNQRMVHISKWPSWVDNSSMSHQHLGTSALPHTALATGLGHVRVQRTPPTHRPRLEVESFEFPWQVPPEAARDS